MPFVGFAVNVGGSAQRYRVSRNGGIEIEEKMYICTCNSNQ